MRCYPCAGQGKVNEAVAICVVCGMGICADHAIREELLVEDIIDWGLGQEKVRYPYPLPRMICPDCKRAIEQRRKKTR
jgi:hypothetical protein